MYNTMLKLRQLQRIVEKDPQRAINLLKGRTFVITQYAFSPFTGKDTRYASTRAEVVAILPELFLKNDFNRLTPMSGELFRGIVMKTSDLAIFETKFFIFDNTSKVEITEVKDYLRTNVDKVIAKWSNRLKIMKKNCADEYDRNTDQQNEANERGIQYVAEFITDLKYSR
jgi:hypothetical protein